MSEDRNRGSRDFSQYDSMTTEDLEEILRLDAEAPMEQESDTEFILYIMEVLANRNTNNTGKTAQESWESFQQYYLPAEEELSEYTPGTKKPERSARPWLRRLMAAAAAIVLVLCIPLTVKASDWEDIWNVVAKWAKETFSFMNSEYTDFREPGMDDSIEYSSLEDLLKRSNRPYHMIPTWIPDGYKLHAIEKDVTPAQEVYLATYMDEEKLFTIRVQSHISTDLQNVEVKEDLTEIISKSGVQYYIFSNMDQIQVIWIQESYECNISGDISLEDAKKMINSIGKG